ncbi:hypothetical protein HK104_009056 [Borealophlyctis nickersoniae]|nr:hypothetical protein HK104_009056 [Borealophlyctis nickersoniae]
MPQVVDMITNDNAAAVIGPSSNEDSLHVAVVSSVYHVPVCDGEARFDADVSTFATTFFRTIPSHKDQSEAILKLIAAQGWKNYFAVQIGSIDAYGTNHADISADMAAENGLKALGFAIGDGTDAQIQEVLSKLQSSKAAVVHYIGDGSNFGNVLTQARDMGMLTSSYVWITTDDVYQYHITNGTTDETLFDGIWVVSLREGSGPEYAQLLNRWQDTTVRDRNQAVFCASTDLHRTCVELFMAGYDRMLRSNSSLTLADLSLGYNGPVTQLVSIPSTFSFPNTSFATGVVTFRNGTGDRIGNYTFSYSRSGSLVPFGYVADDGSAIINNTIVYRDGSTTTPPDTVINDDDATRTAKILAPVLVIVVIFCGMVAIWAFMRDRKRRRREDEEFYEKAKLAKVSLLGKAPVGRLPFLSPYEAPKLDVSAPVQKAIEVLQRVKERNNSTRMTQEEIDFILEVLTSNEGFTPNIDGMHYVEGPEMDAETRAWVLDAVLGTRQGMLASPQSAGVGGGSSFAGGVSKQGSLTRDGSSRRVGSPSQPPSQHASDQSMSTEGLGPMVPTPNVVRDLRDQRRFSVMRPRSEMAMTSSIDSASIMRAPPTIPEGDKTPERHFSLDGKTNIFKELEAVDANKIRDYLDLWYCSWNFDMFLFAEMTNGHPLYFSALYAFQSHGLLAQFEVNLERFKQWLLLMESEYHPHPYHNAVHAADVLHALNYLLIEDPKGQHYTPLEAMAGMLAAVGHDIDHPGVSNNFIIKRHHPWALLYNDHSVLEMHHCSHMFITSHNSSCNIFADFTPEEYEETRKIIIRLIFATDMAKHFEYLNKFRSKLSANALSHLDTVENRLTVMEIALKCADLTNPSKTFALSSKWTEVVMEEFYRQGDQERELGMPISQFMDRATTNVPKCQIGFIDILVAPLYEAWNTFNGNAEKTAKIHKEILKNRTRWTGLSASNPGPPQLQAFQQGSQPFQGVPPAGLAASTSNSRHSLSKPNIHNATAANVSNSNRDLNSPGHVPAGGNNPMEMSADKLASMVQLPSEPGPGGVRQRLSDTGAAILESGGIIVNSAIFQRRDAL